jgi:hypothetical protein
MRLFLRLLPLTALLAARLCAAGLEFPQTLKEIHAPADAERVTADFNFQNHTDKPVVIKSFKPTCSCVAAEVAGGKLTYAPGESGVLRATFKMENFSGTVDKAIPLWLDGDPEESPSVTLTVRVHIPILVLAEPKTLKWNVGSDPVPQKIRIRMNHQEPIHVTNTTSSSEAFTLSLATIQDGREYELTVTPKATTTQGLAVIRLETDCKVQKQRMQQVFAIVRKPTPGELIK